MDLYTSENSLSLKGCHGINKYSDINIIAVIRRWEDRIVASNTYVITHWVMGVKKFLCITHKWEADMQWAQEGGTKQAWGCMHSESKVTKKKIFKKWKSCTKHWIISAKNTISEKVLKKAPSVNPFLT